MSEIITDTHVFFYSDTILSNFHWTQDQFRYGAARLPFNSSEVCFMYVKALFFNDAEAASKIAAAKSSFDAKALGRQVKGYVDKEWECVREGFMTHVLLAKFSQNPEWAAQLKATGSRILVECSPTDGIWGVKMSVEDAAAFIARDAMNCCLWPGRNLLGEALMKVRVLL